jgi:CHASE2 domain-containing sensor protein
MDPNELMSQVGSQSPGLLLWGMVWSSIGVGFFLYGKRQSRAVPLLAGILLSVLPFFVTSVTALAISGGVLTSLPWFLRGRW